MHASALSLPLFAFARSTFNLTPSIHPARSSSPLVPSYVRHHRRHGRQETTTTRRRRRRRRERERETPPPKIGHRSSCSSISLRPPPIESFKLKSRSGPDDRGRMIERAKLEVRSTPPRHRASSAVCPTLPRSEIHSTRPLRSAPTLTSTSQNSYSS